ncbi:hypothetical protein CTE07_42260 [Chitinophaga terrae (ex Kim and Jung 2007)]|nr:hypothetical protein CTE07_42260 [Chitinophaga terrae (ex Kim and Jung 2007)]
MLINRALNTLANTPLAGTVVFPTHQVEAAFQVRKARKTRPKYFPGWDTLSAIYNSGVNAIKIKGVKGIVGHASQNNKPLIKLSKK